MYTLTNPPTLDNGRSINFGHNPNILEGSTYSRRYLFSTHAHRSDQRGVNGNVLVGSDSIVVSRQSPDCREEDGLVWLRYTSNRRQGSGALCLSYTQQYPLRVFRSSNLTTVYAPPKLTTGQTAYRYDGLYVITKVWNAAGRLMTVEDSRDVPAGGQQYTFHLDRLPTSALSVDMSDADITNSMDIYELWNNIQNSRVGRHYLIPFVQSHPKYNQTLPRIMNDVDDGTSNFNMISHLKLPKEKPANSSAPFDIPQSKDVSLH